MSKQKFGIGIFIGVIIGFILGVFYNSPEGTVAKKDLKKLKQKASRNFKKQLLKYKKITSRNINEAIKKTITYLEEHDSLASEDIQELYSHLKNKTNTRKTK